MDSWGGGSLNEVEALHASTLSGNVLSLTAVALEERKEELGFQLWGCHTPHGGWTYRDVVGVDVV